MCLNLLFKNKFKTIIQVQLQRTLRDTWNYEEMRAFGIFSLYFHYSTDNSGEATSIYVQPNESNENFTI